jgi:hypothetical protein
VSVSGCLPVQRVRLGPARVIEQADAAPAEIARHGPDVADVRQGTGDHDPVEEQGNTAPISSRCCSTKASIVRLRQACRITQTTADPPCLVPASPGWSRLLCDVVLICQRPELVKTRECQVRVCP